MPGKYQTPISIPLAACLLAPLCLNLQAQTPPADDGQATPAPRVSTFRLPARPRNPFWAVGWTPQKSVEVDAVAPISAESFILSAILLGPPHYAVINGKDYGEGAIIKTEAEGKPVEVRVVKIVDGFVLLDYRGSGITVELRRR